MKLGIDISVHNGIVNMQMVKDAGYEMVMIRAGYGNDNTDQKYVTNAAACCSASIPTGIYWFSYAYNTEMARREGGFALAMAQKYWKKCPVAFDLEYDTVSYARKNGVEISRALATDMAIAFLQVIVDGGYTPVLYTNKDYKENYFDLNRIQASFQEKIYIWYARYTSSLNDQEKELADIWQKSSTGRVPGISGNVDINEIYTEFNEIADQPVNPPSAVNMDVLYFQKAANLDGYRDPNGALLIEDGINGPKTKYVCQRVLLKAQKTDTGYTTGSRGQLVIWWQSRMNEMGFQTTADGYFGANTRTQTLAFQKKYQLSVDGIVGINSITAMFLY